VRHVWERKFDEFLWSAEGAKHQQPGAERPEKYEELLRERRRCEITFNGEIASSIAMTNHPSL
jgi:hypothetical protein